MTMHRLELFASIAKHLNITKAARELRISQPSISQQLKCLQDDFQISLFRKNGRGIELTEQGHAFLKDVQFTLSQIEALKKKYGVKLTNVQQEHFTLGGSHGPSASFLPSLMAVFSKRYPLVNLTLRTGSSPQIQDWVLNSHVEIGIVTRPRAIPSLRLEPCRFERLAVFAPKDHPLAKKEKLEPAELASARLVVRVGGEGAGRTEQILSRWHANGPKPRIAVRCEFSDSVKAAVRNGAGIGILYQDMIEEEVRKGEFKLLKVTGIKLIGRSYIAYLKEKPLSKNAQDFLRLLRAARTRSKISSTEPGQLPSGFY